MEEVKKSLKKQKKRMPGKSIKQLRILRVFEENKDLCSICFVPCL